MSAVTRSRYFEQVQIPSRYTADTRWGVVPQHRYADEEPFKK